MTKQQSTLLEHVQTDFLEMAKEAFGDNLRSVTVYGSAIEGRFVDGQSDVNVLIILGSADPKAVSALGRSASKVMRRNRITPLLLTESEFTSSADVFPMEYLDIRDARQVVFGDDLAGRLEITMRNLRHQVEGELRGAVAALRRALLETAGRNRQLKRILSAWFGSQAALFRGLLRLAGSEEIPTDPLLAIALLSDTYHVDVSALERAARLRMGERLEPSTIAHELLSSLSELLGHVDSMEA